MLRMQYHYEPLENKPPARNRKRSSFSASFDKTLDLLDRELNHLKARNVVLQIDAERHEFRLDGMLRAGAKPRGPAVAISFDSRFGHLTYPCDTYDDWVSNLRAIGLALEALRAVDRYGVSGKGQQYTGWNKLPPPPEPTVFHFSNRHDALTFLRTLVDVPHAADPLEPYIRAAEKKTHPDLGGDARKFKLVQAARAILLGGGA